MQQMRRLNYCLVSETPTKSPTSHTHRLRESAHNHSARIEFRNRGGSFVGVVKIAIDFVTNDERFRAAFFYGLRHGAQFIARQSAAGRVGGTGANDNFRF